MKEKKADFYANTSKNRSRLTIFLSSFARSEPRCSSDSFVSISGEVCMSLSPSRSLLVCVCAIVIVLGFDT